MLGDKVKTIEITEGTTEDLLSSSINDEQRFMVKIIDYIITEFKIYALGKKLTSSDYMDMTLRIISNISINCLVPVISCGPKGYHEEAIKLSIDLISDMIYSGWKAHQEVESSKENIKH